MSIQFQLNHLCNTFASTSKPNPHKTPSYGTTTTTTTTAKRKPRPTFRAQASAPAPAPSSSGASARELIQSGAVRAVRAGEARQLVGSVGGAEGFALLDVRPAWERERARVAGSLHVALFVKDEDNGPVTLLKKWVHFGYIGLWTGQYFTTLNPQFVELVEETVPDKSTKLLVACGEGLRSLMAISKLYNAGYKNLGWLAGGFNRSEDGDFPAVEGTEKLEYATIGGVSYIFLQLLILLRAVGKNTS